MELSLYFTFISTYRSPLMGLYCMCCLCKTTLSSSGSFGSATSVSLQDLSGFIRLFWSQLFTEYICKKVLMKGGRLQNFLNNFQIPFRDFYPIVTRSYFIFIFFNKFIPIIFSIIINEGRNFFSISKVKSIPL